MFSSESSSLPADGAIDGGAASSSSAAYGFELEAALSSAQQRLQSFAQSATAFDQLSGVFAMTAPTVAQAQIEDWADGLFANTPSVVLLEDGLLKGAAGAYSADRDTIYLAASLTQNDDLLGQVWLEEYGHALDQRFNPGEETAGDEGELFRHTVLGTDLTNAELSRIRQENDWGTLLLDGTPIVVEMDNTTSTAVNIGTLVGNRNLTGTIGGTDTNDFYRFSVTSAGTFKLNMTGLAANANVQLLNSSGVVVATSAQAGTTAESISRQLSAGSYFIRVYASSGSTNYRLGLNFDAAGNTLTTARPVGTLSSTRSFNDFVGSIDTNDYYRFSLGTTSTFRLNMTGLSANADVQLLNSSGGIITSSAATGTTAESISRQLSAGNYYVRVFPRSGNTNYSLSLGATPVDGAGNTLATAFNVGTFNGTQSVSRTFNDFVGSSDTNDYYRVTFTNPVLGGFLLSGLSADANVDLLDSAGNLLMRFATPGTANESASGQVLAGTFYIRVYPGTANSNTNYTLRLATSPLA